MKLTAKTDLDAPAAAVFAGLIDHPLWEREAVRRGAEVTRPDDMPQMGIGAGWWVRFQFRGKVRKLLIRIEAQDPDRLLTLAFTGQAIEGTVVVDLLALSARRTRMRVSTTIKARTLAARLFLNTLRLARGRVQARYELRLAQLAARILARQTEAQGQTQGQTEGQTVTRIRGQAV